MCYLGYIFDNLLYPNETLNNMKWKATLAALIVIIVTVLIVCSLRLSPTAERGETYALPASVAEQVELETRGMNAEQVVDYAIDFTTSQLRFATSNDIPRGRANCVGYAQLCAAVCNRGFISNGLCDRACPVVGDVRLWGARVCGALKALPFGGRWKAFVKDHDFVRWNRSVGTAVCLDACTDDYLFTPCWTDIP